MRRLIIAAFGAYLTLGFSALSQENINPTNPLNIASAIRDLGYKALLEKDSEGDPVVRSKIDGTNFSIFFYDCINGADCESLQFSAGFNLTDGSNLAAMNDWNRRKRYGKAHLDDDNDPFLRYDFNLGGSGAGISNVTFEENFLTWEILIRDFKAHINW